MARVEVIVNGRRYAAECASGEEERLHRLAAYVDEKMAVVTAGDRSRNDPLVLVLTAMLLADEVLDLRDETQSLRARLAAAPTLPMADPTPSPLAATVDLLARRIEDIAGRMEQA